MKKQRINNINISQENGLQLISRLQNSVQLHKCSTSSNFKTIKHEGILGRSGWKEIEQKLHEMLQNNMLRYITSHQLR